MRTVSQTARWSAAARAIESSAPDAIIRDPYAEHLAGQEGFEMFEAFGGAGLGRFVAVRTRYLDDAILDAVHRNGIRQVVLVAAGMDTRGFRLDFPAGTHVFEIDHADLLAVKDEELADIDARPNAARHAVGADLAANWWSPLIDAGFDITRPAIWVPEALLHYLSDSSVRGLLRTMRELSAPGSVLAVDVVGAGILKAPSAQPVMDAVREEGTAWNFGTDDPEGLLESCDWRPVSVKQPGEDGASFGRWPFPPPPRSRSGIPRNFLTTSTTSSAI